MIELCSVSVGYGQNTVLQEASASFDAGRLTSVIGVNGCGKSTLLKAMLGILPLTGGEIRLDGADIRTMQRNEIAKRIAYLSQGKNPPDMTVGQMVLCGRFPYLSYPRRYRESDRAVAREAMERVGILHLADQPLSALSGGMRQIAYIAMALAQETDYILLDEPTTYLDIAHQLELMRLLKTLSESGKGIVAVMHDLPLAFDFSDGIAVLQGGTVAAQAAPSVLCELPLIREIFGVRVRPEGDARYRYQYP
jgi:iron complex transport system ATP-binding protein